MGKRKERKQQASSGRRMKLDLSSDDVVDPPPSETQHSKEMVDVSLGEEVMPIQNHQGNETLSQRLQHMLTESMGRHLHCTLRASLAGSSPVVYICCYLETCCYTLCDDEVEEDDVPSGQPASAAHGDAVEEDYQDKNVVHPRHIDEELLPQLSSEILPSSSMSQDVENENVDHSSRCTEAVVLGNASTVEQASVTSQWQAVLHEESGEYYYWNLKTGETTWEDPNVQEKIEHAVTDLETQPATLITILAEVKDTQKGHDSISNAEGTPPCHEIEESADAVAKTSLEADSSEHIEAKGNQDDASVRSDVEVLEKKDHGYEVIVEDGIQQDSKSDAVCMNEAVEENIEKKDGSTKIELVTDAEGCVQTVVDEGHAENEMSVTSIDPQYKGLKHETLLGSQLARVEVPDEELKGTEGLECKENLMDENVGGHVEDRRNEIVVKGDALVQRLSSLARDSLSEVPNYARMAIQAEARISDWKGLLSLGIFMPEPYWLYIQSQLAQLEALLAIEEAAAATALEAPNCSLEERHTSGIHHLENAAGWSSSWAGYWEEVAKRQEPWKSNPTEGPPGNGSDVEEGEVQIPHSTYHNVYMGMSGVPPDGNLLSRKTADVGSFGRTVDAEMDMEVDMEVDEEVEAEPAVPGLSSDAQAPSYEVALPTYPFNVLSMTGSNASVPMLLMDSGQPSLPPSSSEGWVPPLPPDDEWAPPPPSDTEIIPPPPPEEPPPLPPPSPSDAHLYSVSALPPVDMGDYCTAEYPSGYMAAPDFVPPAEYQPLPESSLYGLYAEEVPGVLYATSTQTTDITGLDSYSIQPDSGLGYNAWTTTVLPAVMPLVPVPVMVASSHVPQSFDYVQPASTSSVPDAPSVPAPASTTAEGSVAAVNVEPKKVVKGKLAKKRTHSIAVAPMLMTNKKVSSLVNKWKQAKEELHGSKDDEDDRALYDPEALEKKKQKEIEEWRKQQIASGGALDNANFQPLGTLDWRERVKRAKKADTKEGRMHADLLSSVPEVQKEEPKKAKPDLTEISKSLPLGWQAYWDDASGEVYYGSSITQETSWDRPVT